MKVLRPIMGLLLMSFSVQIILSSLSLGIGNLQSPGPGFMGFLSSLLLFILTAIIFAKENIMSAKEKGEEPSISWSRLSKPIVLTLALCGYIFLLETIGYLLSTFLLMFIMLLVSNPRKWYLHLLNAFIIVNVTYIVFYKMLRVLLPVGTFRIYW